MTACALLLYHVIVARATAHDKPAGWTSSRGERMLSMKKHYALSWNPSDAYRYSDEAIRDIGCQIAEVIAFESKAERDDYVDGEAYIEAISAKRAYRINPTLAPSFCRRHPNW